MAVISITTTQNIELEYDLASLGDRIVASLIDNVIKAANIIIVVLSTGIASGSFDNSFGWVIVLLFLPVAFYSLLSEIFLNGQSVGKKVMGIKVISINGNPATFGQYLMRWLFRLVDLIMFSGLIAVITVAVTEKHQRVGDLIAGTTLVKTKPRTNIEQNVIHTNRRNKLQRYLPGSYQSTRY